MSESFFKSSIFVVSLRALGVGLALLYSVILARLVNVDGTGLFFLVLSMATILSMIATWGQDHALLRFAARFSEAGHLGKIAPLFRSALTSATIRTGVLGFLAAGILTLISSLGFQEESSATYLELFPSIAISALFLSINAISAECLKGLGRPLTGVFFQGVSVNLIYLLILYPLVTIFGIQGALYGFAFACTLTSVFAVASCKKILRQQEVSSDIPKSEFSAVAKDLFFANFSNNLSSYMPIIIVASICGTYEAGLFGVANRMVGAISLILAAVSSITSPRFARYAESGNSEELRLFARHSTAIILTIASPLLLVFFILPEWILSFFGQEFVPASAALVILAIGQTVNLASGTVGQLLVMCGHQRLFMQVSVVSVLVMLGLSPLFVLLGCAFGMALLVALFIVGVNVASIIGVKVFLGFWPVFWLPK